MEQKQKNAKKIWIPALLLVACLAVFGILYALNRPATSAGEKAFEVTVIDNNGEATNYKGQTDEEYLRGALEELDGLTISGTDGEYGLVVETVNGVRAIYEKDGAYWGFNVNGTYCNYGVDSQPVNDGDKFEIVYTPAE